MRASKSGPRATPLRKAGIAKCHSRSITARMGGAAPPLALLVCALVRGPAAARTPMAMPVRGVAVRGPVAQIQMVARGCARHASPVAALGSPGIRTWRSTTAGSTSDGLGPARSAMDKDKGKKNDWRTSSGAFVNRARHEIVNTMHIRAAHVTRSPATQRPCFDTIGGGRQRD